MIYFKTEKEAKMKFFDFGAVQKIMQMLSHDKIIVHMLFGAFHDTHRIEQNLFHKIGFESKLIMV